MTHQERAVIEAAEKWYAALEARVELLSAKGGSAQQGALSDLLEKLEALRASARKAPEGRPVVVTTAHRGVFFGYAKDTTGNTIKLERARLCIYWPNEVKGFMGLASGGPTSGSRVGHPADIELRDITAVLEATPEAVARWEAAPWAK